MDTLPLFLSLLKKNLILSAIIAGGNFSKVYTSNLEYVKWSDSAIEIKDFNLSPNDHFESVYITLDSLINIRFITKEAKYFNNTRRYFKRDSPVKNKGLYRIDHQVARTDKKSLGTYEFLENKTWVSVNHSSLYNYSISITFEKKQNYLN